MKNRHLVIFFLLLLCCVLFLGSSQKQNASAIPKPVAHRGVLDLSSWDFDSQGPVELDGEWEFYWKEFLFPEDFQLQEKPGREHFISIPAVWNGYADYGDPLPGAGYATFRLRLQLPPSVSLLSIKTKDTATAYKLWAGNRLLAQNGIVASTQNGMTPQYLPLLASFPVFDRSTDLILQVSNFYHRNGGPWTSFLLGTESQLRHVREVLLGQEIFLAGSLLVMGLYHVGLYAFRRTDFSFLWLGIFCLVLMLRILSSGERLLVYYWNFPWEFASKIEYLTFYILPGIFTSFLVSLYPEETPRTFVRTSHVFTIGFSCIVLMSPTKIYSHTVNYYYIVTIVSCLAYIVILSRASFKKREGALALLLGLLLFGITVVNDILFQSHLIDSRDLVPLGGFTFILFQVIILSQRYSKALTAKEAAELANDAKSQFLSTMSHELRTPLNGILGYTQILKCHDLSASTQEFHEGIDVIERSGNHLLKLINEILDLSKIEAGKTELHYDECSLLDILEGMCAVIDIQAQKKGLRFTRTFEGDFPARILVDERRLSQVLLNLLGNAVKFTSRGDIVFHVSSLGSVEHSFSFGKHRTEASFRFNVEDSGPGIPEERLKDIFSPFFQLDEHARSGEGSGLGLTISKQLIALMGGSLEAENLSGRGCRFAFELRFPICDTYRSKLSVTPTKICGYTWNAQRPIRILVVDDLWESRLVLSGLLAPLGFELYEAHDGKQGVEMASEVQPDVILMDLLMPFVDGYEAIRQIRALQIETLLKIFVVSANILPDTLEHVQDAGGDAVLKKPLSFETLLKTLQQHLPLRWERESVSKKYERRPPESFTLSDSKIPSYDRLERLYQDAKIFQVNSFTQELEILIETSEDYRPFVCEMERLSQKFDWEEICKILSQCLGQKEEER